MADTICIYPHVEQANFALVFDYVNYRGEASRRRVFVQNFQFRASDWHPEPQWLLRAFDVDKQEFRDFAMRDMTNVTATVAAPDAEPGRL